MTNLTHYGNKVTYGACAESFINILEHNNIEFTELPLLDNLVITFNYDGEKKYALITGRKHQQEYEHVFITNAIPDDMDWKKLEIDCSHQIRGGEPEQMNSRFSLAVEKAHNKALDELDENIDEGIHFQSEGENIPEDKLYKTIYRYLVNYGYDVNRIKKINTGDVDHEFNEKILKYNK